MNVKDCMSHDVKVCAPTDTLREAAQTMKEIDAGLLPVGENDRLIGMITDRDIAVRGVAEGKGPDTPIREAMSKEVLYCYDDEEISGAAEKMSSCQLRRLPVLNRQKRLVGILSLGDLARADGHCAGTALHGASQPGGQHVQ